MQSHILVLFLVISSSHGALYTFYRSMNIKAHAIGHRRLFGGAKAQLEEFPRTCLLTDINRNAKCTGTIITDYFALTAAHCIDGRLRLVVYNTRSPTEDKGNEAYILYLYRHPDYQVTQADEGKGMDVTRLKNDVGLVRTYKPMKLNVPIPPEPLKHTLEIVPANLTKVNVNVVGFGRTETGGPLGEELFAVKLLLQPCERATWVNCVCGIAGPGDRSQGVCSGDSGGPVFYNGTQVGVTSMGPLECVIRSDPTPGTTSVFTEIYDYVDIINNTIHNLKGQKMTNIPLAGHILRPTLGVILASIVLSLRIYI